MHLNPQEKLFESFFFIDNCQIAPKKTMEYLKLTDPTKKNN